MQMAKIITDAPVFSKGFTLKKKTLIVANTISQSGFNTHNALNIAHDTVDYSCMHTPESLPAIYDL